jgi:Zn-dependent peptidase ImmA (M78 family)
MAETDRVKINHEILKWAIDRSGYDRDALVRAIIHRFNVKYFTVEYLNELIDGRTDPKLTDLKKIDSLLHRGIPFYFLSFIPRENIMAEFRSKTDARFSPKVELTLRKYHELREEIGFLAQENFIVLGRKTDLFKIEDDPDSIAEYIRETLNYIPEDWKSKPSKSVFDHIRRRMEELNLFVFKDDLKEGVRGCIFIGSDLPTLILVRSDDDKNGEIFTLIHEFCHYLLDSEDILFVEDGNDRVEVWCNRVTSAFLMNTKEEEREGITLSNRELILTPERIAELSSAYKLSKNALMLKFLFKGIVTEQVYRSFLNAYAPRKDRETEGGNWHNTNRDRLSKRYMKLVSESYNKGFISVHDAMEYLNIKNRSRLERYLEAP